MLLALAQYLPLIGQFRSYVIKSFQKSSGDDNNVLDGSVLTSDAAMTGRWLQLFQNCFEQIAVIFYHAATIHCQYGPSERHFEDIEHLLIAQRLVAKQLACLATRTCQGHRLQILLFHTQ